jgi:hypothetical protein
MVGVVVWTDADLRGEGGVQNGVVIEWAEPPEPDEGAEGAEHGFGP